MEGPLDWQVQDLDLYGTFEMDDAEDTILSVGLLIPLDKSHRSDGSFRLILFGGDTDNVQIPAADLFSFLPEDIQDCILNIPCSSSRITIPANCTAGPWEDVTTLIRNDTLSIKYNQIRLILK